MSNVSINEAAAPKEWVAFKQWHAAACKADPLSAEQRYRKMGYKVPKKNVDKPVKKEVK